MRNNFDNPTTSEIKANRWRNVIKNPKSWIFLCMTALAVLWSVGIPFGGVADETTYLHYGVYNTHELFTGATSLPGDLIQNIDSSACFAGGHTEITASCQHFVSSKPGVEAKSSLVPYPKLWFYLTAWPALLFSGEKGLLLARLASTVLSIGTISIGIFFWGRSAKNLALGLSMALPALSVQMLGSYNPNGFEIAGMLAVALLLVGHNFSGDTKLASGWWLSLAAVSWLTSTAKPMSGILVFGVYIFYFSYILISKDSFNPYRVGMSGSAINRNTVKLGIVATIGLLLSYTLSLPALNAAPSVVKSTHLSPVNVIGDFLLRSDGYANEYAGIFGWRDTGTAPWTLTLWIASMALFIFIACQTRTKSIKSYLLGIWVIVFLVAPAMEVLLLAHSYNVGLQTRYLAGIFATVAIITAVMVSKDDVSLNFLPRLQVLLVIVNFYWVYLRFTVGSPTVLNHTSDVLSEMTSVNTWRPVWVGLMALLTIFLIIGVLIPPKMWINRPKNIRRSQFRTAAILVGLLISFGFATQLQVARSHYISLDPNSTLDFSIEKSQFPVGEIYGSITVEQQFKSTQSNMSKVEVQLATWARMNPGTLQFSLSDSNHHSIYSQSISQKTLTDNVYYAIRFPKIADSKDQTYFLNFSSNDSSAGKAVTIWATKTSPSSDFVLKIGGEVVPGSLIFKVFDN